MAMFRLKSESARLSISSAVAGIASAIIAGILLTMAPAAAAQERASPEVVVKQIAPDLYFLFDFDGSNCVFLVPDDGGLLIDTRTHPREGRDLLARIRKITDKPIKWVINSH